VLSDHEPHLVQHVGHFVSGVLREMQDVACPPDCSKHLGSKDGMRQINESPLKIIGSRRARPASLILLLTL
jgi:hypothetical protein